MLFEFDLDFFNHHQESNKLASSQAPSYASPKLSLTHSLTGVKCRATSVAKKGLRVVLIGSDFHLSRLPLMLEDEMSHYHVMYFMNGMTKIRCNKRFCSGSNATKNLVLDQMHIWPFTEKSFWPQKFGKWSIIDVDTESYFCNFQRSKDSQSDGPSIGFLPWELPWNFDLSPLGLALIHFRLRIGRRQISSWSECKIQGGIFAPQRRRPASGG